MRTRRVVVVPHTAAEMYALVDDISSYPEFLPWCSGAEETREGEKVVATLHIRYYGVSTSFTTENRHTIPSRIEMELSSGPLKSLSGGWRFSDIEGGRCRVEFVLEYHFGGALGALFGRVFAGVFSRFVDSFIERADSQDEGRKLKVTVARGEEGEKTLILPSGATVGDALEALGYEKAESAGIFGRPCGFDTRLSSGDRVEVYSPLHEDPRQRRRRRAEQ